MNKLTSPYLSASAARISTVPSNNAGSVAGLHRARPSTCSW